MVHRAVSLALQVTLLGIVGALVAGQLLGQPILLGYVTSGSMEPTMEAGEGFVAIPSELAGEPAVGDVVVYESPTDGSLTTHRIVGTADDGYVTRGDANPFTDQDSGDPAVRDDQIVAEALTLGGSVVTIPGLGSIVEGVRGVVQQDPDGTDRDTTALALAVLALSVGFYAFETVRGRSLRPSEDSGIDPRTIAAGVAILVAVAALSAMLVPAGTQSYDLVSAEFESDRPLVIERGGTATHEYPVANTGLVPVVTYLEAETDTVTPDHRSRAIGPLSEQSMELTFSAPEETGYFPQTITEHRYLHLLPRPIIDWLYGLHPLVPTVSITALLGTVTYIVLITIPGTTGVRSTRTRRREHLHDTSGWWE